MPEVQALAELVKYGNGQQNGLVRDLKAGGMKIAYANPVVTFVGRGGCDDPEWINKPEGGRHHRLRVRDAEGVGRDRVLRIVT
jgi:hypothetical protein